MSTTVRLPDGSKVSVATDDPKQAAAAAQRHWQQRQGPKPRSGWQTAGDFLGDTIDNVIPNFGDEIAAIPDAARAAVKGQPIGEAFNRGRREFKQHQAQYDKEHPALAWGSTLAGLGASVALPVGRAVSGARMGVKALQAAKAGALFGAVSGAGEGDSLGDRATNAAYGAAAGAGLGAVATPLMAGAVRAGRAIRTNVPGAEGLARRLGNVPRAVMQRPLVQPGQRAVEQADRMVNERMGQGNISRGMGRNGPASTPQAIVQEQERRQALNVPAIPGDVTEGMRGLTSWASRGIGPGQELVRRSLDARKATEANRIRGHIVDEMGPAVDPVRQVQEYSERARREAGPMYDEAYAQPMVLTPEMRGIIQTPAFQEAVPNAVRNIRNAQRDPEAMGFVMGRDGQLLPDQHQFLSTEGFDQVIRAMRDNGRAAADINPLTGRVINNTNSVHINARASDLQNELSAQNGAYRDVTGMYADEMGMRDAFQRGGDVKNLTGAEIAEQGRQAPQDNARGAWAIGARTALADEASQYGAKYPTGDTAAMVRKVLGDESKQASVQAMMPDRPGAVAGLQDRLEAEHQGNILWSEVQGNSKTASRQQLDADLDSAAGARTLSSLSPRGMMASVINHIGDRATTQFRNDVKARVAQIATETNPATVRELMAEIADRARQDREFGDLLHRSGAIAAKGAGANIAAPNPSELDDLYAN
jgi:hypothetical protein